MAAGTVADYAASILKTIYSNDAIENSTLSQSPAFGQLPKDETFAGYDFRELCFYGDLQGVGAGFAAAQSAVGNPSDAVYTLTRKETYAVAQLAGWLIEAAKAGDKAAFVSALKRHMDSALHAITLTMSMNVFRDTYMDRGTCTNSTTTVTMANKDDIVLIEKGMPVVFTATASGVLLTTSASTTVSSVNRAAGTFVVASATGLTGTMYVFRTTDSDATTSAGSSGLGITGFRGWMPSTVGTLFGQDCTLDSQRLGGNRYDGSGKSMRECINNAVAVSDRDDSMWDSLFIPPTHYGRLVNELGTNVRYCQEPAMGSKGPSATVGFEGIQIIGPGSKPAKVFADRFCQPGLGYGLKKDVWKLRSLNKAPHILDLDGLTMLRQSTANNYELRWGAGYQLGCRNPGANIVITLPT